MEIIISLGVKYSSTLLYIEVNVELVFYINFDLCRLPVEHFLKAVDEITLEDIYNISQKILSSPLTMASYGDGNLLFFTELYDLVLTRTV